MRIANAKAVLGIEFIPGAQSFITMAKPSYEKRIFNIIFSISLLVQNVVYYQTHNQSIN